MATLELHPEFLSSNGQRQFAVLPYEEYVALSELLEDLEDLRDLEIARKENEGQPSFTLHEVKKELGIN